jgi:pimeloyl-ACP methyl ester carboxylesterase
LDDALPEVRYARSGDVHIAYQVLGEGNVDLVFAMGWLTNLETYWELPGYRHFMQRLAGFTRLILFDKRGMGLSDHTAIGTLEKRMDDVRAVMDAVGSACRPHGHKRGRPPLDGVRGDPSRADGRAHLHRR